MALHDHPRVSQAMRETIKRVAGEMGYVPDPFLQRLAEYRRAGRTAQFHWVIAWLNHWDKPEQLRGYHAFEQYWQGARQASKRSGYQLEEFIWPAGSPAKTTELGLQARGVLGLLIPPHKPEVNWDDFDWSKFSVMRFGMSVRHPDSNLVTADHLRAVVMAIQKIHEYGYQRIGLVYNEAHNRSIGGSLVGGYLWAQKRMGIEHAIPPLDSETKTPQLAARTKRHLDAWMKKFRTDAILADAPEAPLLLRELGYRIPQDVAVAGTSLDVLVDSGIDQHPEAIGQIAAGMLIKQITLNERGEPTDPCRILVESRWQDGKTLPPRR